MGLSLDPKRGMWMLVQLFCSTLCSELLQHCGASTVWLCWVLRAWLVCTGREEAKVPPKTQEV